MSGQRDSGTTTVLLVDLLATIGVVLFVIVYCRYNPPVFAPLVLVTCLLSIVVAVLAHFSNQAGPCPSAKGANSGQDK